MEPLVIDRERVVRLALELASLRKVPLGDAVEDALQTRLDTEKEIARRVESMLALGREIRAHMPEPVSSDHGWLYR